MSETPFQLLIEPRTSGYTVAIVQLRDLANGHRPEAPRTLGRLAGAPLLAATEQLLDALRRSGHRPTDLHAGRRQPLALGHDAGVRIGLLVLALRPLSKPARMELVTNGIRQMPSEEILYWFGKCASRDRAAARRAQHALRVLLAPES